MAEYKKRLNHDLPDFHDEHDSELSNQNNQMNQKNHSADKWGIPGDWKTAKINEIAEIKGGFAFDSTRFKKLGKYQVIKMSNLYENQLDLTRSNSFLDDLTEQESEYVLTKGDIIITLTGTIGKRDYGFSYQIDSEENLLLNQRVAKIKAIKAHTTYISYQIKTNRFLNQFFYSARGGTGNQANVGTQDLGAMKVLLPPLPEQKAIARVLSTADAAIHTTEKLIAQKELRKKWLMQQLLTGKRRLNLDLFDLSDDHDNANGEKSSKSFNHKNHGSDNEKRLPAFANAAVGKKGFGGEWKEYKLSDLFERVIRKNTEGNTTVVTISAQRGFVRQTDFFNKNVASEITNHYFLVEKGEFCYNKSYSNGYPWGATKRLNDFDKAVVTTLYICFGVKDEKKTSPEFFEQFFGANLLDKGLTKIAHEGGRAHGLLNVTPSDFFSLKVTIPSFEEQTAITKVLQAADKEIRLLKMKSEKLKEQKKGLMQMLLTGKKRLLQ